ncbi:quinone-dependent dihydroorotate dehydrogenase [Paenibacillus crassostreae]|uniref:Dihydroorotate dehydrogenase (quinone) n=1 Tax=Paenibacillus crassostreae TaxID=1763538 RepID=A0A167G5G4_9BACL|nr:quinone-dependent dihydroorotate dehydrogenase [Paenibacillus crassostreae]AOZ94792.1 dihydroorotate dehydrogenase (quinone) [Paenibacillus crassostreae]OAB77228.1 dihydroorotate dehydrogenase [Paenibacillus crassostreae]
MLYRNVVKPIFFKLDPEKAHHLVIGGLHTAGSIPGASHVLRSIWGVKESSDLTVDLFGLHFHTPVGLAAGLDKNAVAVKGFSSIGFGFMEVGTVTPKGQPGNDQPRLFRLPSDEALVNRMGFNNDGTEAMARRFSNHPKRQIPVAINIGKNKVTPNEEAYKDYQECIRLLYPHGDFFVVNISSPNTPDLRNLQYGSELSSLLAHIMDEMKEQARKHNTNKHILVKIAPDVSDAELESMVDVLQSSGVSGVIATNTTLSREGLNHSNAKESGGLSGKPLTQRSTDIISRIYKQSHGQLPIIGSGGIFTGKDAYEKIRAGASLVEIYTALIYEGPDVNRKIHAELRKCLRQDGFRHISEAVGADHH